MHSEPVVATMRILIVEDDELVAQALVTALTKHYYLVDCVADGQAAWKSINDFSYDLILLDVVLPQLDGITLCQKIREHKINTPILLLTVQDSSSKKVAGLDAGADDYVTKPFDLQELLARMRALLRRGESTLPPVLRWEKLQLNPGKREVSYDNSPISLTPKEYSLLELFLRNSQRVFNRSAIIDCLWSWTAFPGEETVTVHIKGLRQKLKAAGLTQDPIETVYGIGYRLKPAPMQPSSTQSLAPQQHRSLSAPGKYSTAIIWQRVRDKFKQRMVVIERASNAIAHDCSSQQLQQLAAAQAHKLVGSLGMFNFHRGAKLAQEVEQVLQTTEPLNRKQKQRLAVLIAAMQQQLAKAMTAQPPELLAVEARPVLLIVEQDQPFAEELVQEAATWEIQGVIASDVTQAQQWLSQQQPDAVLLDLSCVDNLELLTQLHAYTPPIAVLVLTNQDSLIDRVEVIRLGGRVFLHKTMPSHQILQAVQQVLEQSRPVQAKVMVVDDDPQILMAISNLLPPWGMVVSTLAEPLQFWEALRDNHPDLLILDAQMPHISGVELCKLVRNDPRWAHLPVLFLSTHKDAQTMHRLFAAGGDDCVSKPIVEPELVNRILNRWERSHLRRTFAEIDALTGIANRHKFIQELLRLLEQVTHYHQPLCFAVLNLEHLKQINSQYGYAVGDQILCMFGDIIRQNFFSMDIVGRWGGAEFVVAMSGLTRSDGHHRLSQLRQALHQQEFITPNGQRLAITFQAGVVQFPQDGTSLLELYQAASDLLLHTQQR